MSSAEQIATNLEKIRQRIRDACLRSQRDPFEITILGASKSQPIERLRWAWEAGMRVFGENRVQEAVAKMSALPSEAEWHLIGPLQSNKVNKAVLTFRTIHSIDRLKIARALDRRAAEVGIALSGFLEVNLAGEETKHGFRPDDLLAHLDRLHELEALDIVGLMALPPYEPEPEDSRVWFRRLRDLRDEICARAGWGDFPGMLSMGMSQDYPIAVEEGATHVRIGTALFGARES
jgi:pyridoxal phosphate enzyme (YggS family)